MTLSRLPRSSANERRHLPYASSCQKGKGRGESNISRNKVLFDFPGLASSSVFDGKRPVISPLDYNNVYLTLFKLENRNPTRLVQKPKWMRLRGKTENVYSGTRTFWFSRDRSNIESMYRSTHFHFCPSISSNLASVPISSDLLKYGIHADCRCGGVRRANLLGKNAIEKRKHPSRASTKELTVNLEKFWLFGWYGNMFGWYGNTFLNFQQRNSANWPLASPSALHVTRRRV